MTSAITANPLPPPAPANEMQLSAVPRSWLGQVMLDTVGRAGARVGVVWIAIVAACAVLAPVLANSYPLLIKMDGRVSSPMVENLTAVDWTLLIGTPVGVVLAFVKRFEMRRRLGILLIAMGLTMGLGFIFARPGLTQVYDRYRTARADERVQWVINAPISFSPSDRLRDQFDPNRPHPWPPLPGHWLGTENNGEDILSNLIHACRIAMSIGFLATGIEIAIGIVVGGLMGYFVGWVDLLGMRLVEVFGAIPTIYLLLTFVAYYERNIYMIMVIIGLTGWTSDARFVRAEFLRLRQQDFVHAAVAAGLPLRSILFRHLLPNALAPLLVSASFGVASAIIAESTLSFLGLGLVDQPSWGRLLNQAVGAGGGFHWWLATFPGLAIFFTVFAYNLIGEALRDALDPRLRGVK